MIDDVTWHQRTWARPRAPARHGSLHPPGTLGGRPTGWGNGLQFFLITGVSEAPSEKPGRCVSVYFIHCQWRQNQKQTRLKKKELLDLFRTSTSQETWMLNAEFFTKCCDAWYKQVLWDSTFHLVQLLRLNKVKSTLRFDSPACYTIQTRRFLMTSGLHAGRGSTFVC